jgi:beta-lactamase class A
MTAWQLQCFAVLLGSFALATTAFAGPKYPLLRDRIDPAFQKSVEEAARKVLPKRADDIENRQASIVVVDISDLEEPRVAEWNGDLTLYAASLPKIAILVAAFVKIERGELEFSDELRDQMTQMVRKSSNPATNQVLEQVGFETVAEVVQSERYRFYDSERGGGLWVGKDYGGGKNWKRDPLHGLSHAASAMAVARLYYLLVTDRLVAPEYKDAFMEILSNPKLGHKIVGGLKEKNPDAKIFRKSGTWRDFHADSGIIIDPKNYSYILVVVAKDESGEERLRLFAQAVDAAVEARPAKIAP